VSSDDALGDEMHAPDRDPLALDQGTADRLLAGTLDPADAPPAYAEVARVLTAAAGPPQPGELAGEAEAVARFAAAAAGPSRGPARRRRLARLAVASAAVLGLLSAGGAVSATGGVPATGKWLNRAVDAVVGRSRTADSGTTVAPPAGSTATTTAASVRSGGLPGRVPGTTMQRTIYPERLCAAWQPGRGTNMDAAALQALAATAGGGDRIAAYCRALDRRGSDGDGQGSRPAPSGNGNQQGNQPGDQSGGKPADNPTDRDQRPRSDRRG
jgi:hypothetical protein